jgi:hypothetical protein
MTRLKQLDAVAVSVSGFALWVAIGHAVRRNVYMLGRAVVTSPQFSIAVFAAFGLALVLILRGVSAMRTSERDSVFVFMEAPLTFIVVIAVVRVVTAWQIVGDAGPADPIGISDRLPVLVMTVLNGYVFYSLTAIFVVAVIGVFVCAYRVTAT